MIEWHVGDVVRKLRDARGWTQPQLARRGKIDKGTVVNFELRPERSKTGTLARIAAALDMTEQDIWRLVPRSGSVLEPSIDLDQKGQPPEVAIETHRVIPVQDTRSLTERGEEDATEDPSADPARREQLTNARDLFESACNVIDRILTDLGAEGGDEPATGTTAPTARPPRPPKTGQRHVPRGRRR